MGALQMSREANLTLPYKVKSHCTSIILKTLVDFSAKIQPQGILGSGEDDFWRFLPYMGMMAILVNRPWPF